MAAPSHCSNHSRKEKSDRELQPLASCGYHLECLNKSYPIQLPAGADCVTSEGKDVPFNHVEHFLQCRHVTITAIFFPAVLGL